MDMSRIEVNIDHLVLRGFEPADGERVAEGLTRELSQLLSDPATRKIWLRSLRTPVLRLKAIGLEAGISGRRNFGAGIARAIGKGLK
jgi:hypothetical protein